MFLLGTAFQIIDDLAPVVWPDTLVWGQSHPVWQDDHAPNSVHSYVEPPAHGFVPKPGE